MGEVARQQVVDVPLVQAIQAKAEVVQVRVHLIGRPEAISAVESSVKAYNQVSDVTLRKAFDQFLEPGVNL